MWRACADELRSDMDGWWASKRGACDVAFDAFVCAVAMPLYLCGQGACIAGPVIGLGIAAVGSVALVVLQLV